MCPLGTACPNDERLRWPHSNTKCVNPFGKTCPFAHHTNELWFPQWEEESKGVEEKKNALEKMKQEENPRDPWVTSGVVKPMLSQQYNKKVKKTLEEATAPKKHMRNERDEKKAKEMKKEKEIVI